jgi:hypothetical protein
MHKYIYDLRLRNGMVCGGSYDWEFNKMVELSENPGAQAGGKALKLCCCTLDTIFDSAVFLGDDSEIFGGLPTKSYSRKDEEIKLINTARLSIEEFWKCSVSQTKSRTFVADSFEPDCQYTLNFYQPEDQSNFFLGKRIGMQSVSVDPESIRGAVSIPELVDKSPHEVLTRLIGVKWACGTSMKAHLYCDRLYLYLVLKYGEWVESFDRSYRKLDPAPWKKDTIGFFTYMLGLGPSDYPMLRYPTTEEVVHRYLRYDCDCDRFCSTKKKVKIKYK